MAVDSPVWVCSQCLEDHPNRNRASVMETTVTAVGAWYRWHCPNGTVGEWIRLPRA